MEEDPTVAQCRGRVGQLISGKWRLDALIGVGGMAAVYMATHRNGSVGAIKLLHDEVAMNDEVRERFLREAYIANKVGHPGTVKVLDDDVDEHGTPYLVMELLQGESVESRADKAGGRLSINETLDIVDQVLAVLESAHEHSIIHRDLKPENLFLVKDAQVKVLDFGIARLREENSRKTQTGMVMGTPSFMAPEQAMGRWNDVDARTDLYAVGATAFTLLTGLPVHEAETAGEMLVAAATRPARSLARVLNNAPFALVAMVDRALSYERDHRFPDAAAFRAELAKVRNSLTHEAVSKTQISPQAQVIPATVHGGDAPDGYTKIDRGERLDTFDPSTNSPEEIDRMQAVFTLLERALVARKQYGDEHPETKRRTEECFKELASALMSCDICLAWNFTPYAFVAGDNVIWEPEPPWNRIPYQLFSDGVRTMGLVPGLDEQEFHDWLDLITIDPTTDLAPEDDLVTSLWDAGFAHVFHQAVDSFAEGNQDQRAEYEAERKAVIDGAHTDHIRDAAQAWRHRQAEGGARADAGGAGTKTKQVIDFINKSSPLDAEAAARVANMNLQDGTPEEVQASQALVLDPATRSLLAARLDIDVGSTSERFVVAAAEAFVASAKMGRSQAVTAPLRRAVDGLCAGEPEKAMNMIVQLRETVQVDGKQQETDSLRNTITAEILSPKTLLEILKGSSSLAEERRQSYLKGLSKVLECIQSQHFESAIAFLPEAPAGKIRELIMEFLRRAGKGYETKIGVLFSTADLQLGLDLVRLLVSMETDKSREAIAMAADSRHPLVRIEALGHLEGVSGTRVRTELRKLLEDDQVDVRLAALKAMEQHQIAAAGPFLVLRIQDKAFLKLPIEEREQSLQTLCMLRPRRCEEICMALLSESRLFRSGAFETTRELAARFLAEVASTDSAFHLLQAVASSKPWQNGKSVRAAAQAAIDRLQSRAQELLEARKSAIQTKRSEGETAAATGAPGTRTTGAKKRRAHPGSRTGATKAVAGKPGADKSTAAARVTAAPAAPGGIEKEGDTAVRKKRAAQAGPEPEVPGRNSTAAGGD